MYLSVDAHGVRLFEQDDFKALSVVILEGRSVRELSSLGLSPCDQDHVWIDRDLIPRLAANGGRADWRAGFDAMVAYARRQGWVDDADRIRAHITT